MRKLWLSVALLTVLAVPAFAAGTVMYGGMACNCNCVKIWGYQLCVCICPQAIGTT